MARLTEELVERAEAFSHRMLDVAETVERQRRSARIVDQITGCGTSVGANVCEADEAMSPKDFVRALGVAVKELSESRFWLRLVAKRDWIEQTRLDPLIQECMELRRIFGTMIARTKSRASGGRRVP
ncbi:MAG: four helix bundle protein [Phycisphaeraceae bacterium]|nr:four helix bundle protein [Phycisphaeraceae bacterium]